MLIRDRTEGTSHHRTGGIGNDVVAHLDGARQAYTGAGLLRTIEACAIAFDRLAGQWSTAYRDKQHPLFAWIEHAQGRGSRWEE